MELRTVKHVADLIVAAGWNPRIEFAMHGEPTLNPKLPAMIKAVRRRMPKAYLLVTSNGVPLIYNEERRTLPQDEHEAAIHARLDELFKAGLNTYALDNYVTLHDKISKHVRTYTGVPVHEYPENPKASPHTRIQEQQAIVVADISVTSAGTHSHLANHCGLAAPLDTSMMDKRCAKPFRELSIRWDGNVAVCCDTWDGWGAIDNIMEYDDINELWQHPYFDAFRRMLMDKGRVMGPCYGCTARSFRVGLLPDKYGKKNMPRFNDKAKDTLEECLLKGPLTAMVERPWLTERKKYQVPSKKKVVLDGLEIPRRERV